MANLTNRNILPAHLPPSYLIISNTRKIEVTPSEVLPVGWCHLWALPGVRSRSAEANTPRVKGMAEGGDRVGRDGKGERPTRQPPPADERNSVRVSASDLCATVPMDPSSGVWSLAAPGFPPLHLASLGLRFVDRGVIRWRLKG